MSNRITGALAMQAALSCALALGNAAQANPTYTTFDVPGAVGTYPSSIAGGRIGGGWYDGVTYHGFVRKPNGNIANVDPPGSVNTYVTSINASGEATGQFVDSNNNGHGFTRSPDGSTITSFDPPGSNSTYPAAINSTGEIAGQFDSHFFIRDPNGTQYTIYDVYPTPAIVVTAGINNSGSVTGSYGVQQGQTIFSHSFVRDAAGNISSIDVPGSSETSAAGIDGAGRITGSYDFGDGLAHGFLRKPNTNFVLFDVPGAEFTIPSSIWGGEIAGTFRNAHLKYRGFIRDTTGAITTVHVSGSVHTYIASIWNGKVTGTYIDGSGATHGYLWTP